MRMFFFFFWNFFLVFSGFLSFSPLFLSLSLFLSFVLFGFLLIIVIFGLAIFLCIVFSGFSLFNARLELLYLSKHRFLGQSIGYYFFVFSYSGFLFEFLKFLKLWLVKFRWNQGLWMVFQPSSFEISQIFWWMHKSCCFLR